MQEQIQRFLDHLVSTKRVSTHTTLAYRNDLSQFQQFLKQMLPAATGSITWSALTPMHVEAYVAHMKAQDYATATVARKLAALRSMFEFLSNQNVLQVDLGKTLSAPKVKRNAPRTLLPVEVERLLEAPTRHNTASSLRDRAMLEVLYATGMRVSELVNLDADDCDLQKSVLHINVKGARNRSVPLNSAASNALTVYVSNARAVMLLDPGERSLFVNQRGQRLTRQGLWLILKQLVKQAGITVPVTPHILRHSFIANQLKNGAKLQDVRQQVGNISPISMQAYKGMVSGNQIVIDGKVVGQ